MSDVDKGGQHLTYWLSETVIEMRDCHVGTDTGHGREFQDALAPPGSSARPTGNIEQLQIAWLQFLGASGRRASSTVRCYESDLGQLVEFLGRQGHSMQPEDLRPADVARFRDSSPNWKASTVRRKLAAVSAFFDWMVEHAHMQANPAASVARPETQAADTAFVTPDDALAMLLECRDDRERAILMTLWRAGPRYQELQNLRVQDIDLSRNELQVTGKGGHVAAVPILSDLKPYLLRWLEARPDVDHDLLFTSRTGAPMYDKCLRRLISRLIRHAGLQDRGYTPHSFRHGCATALYEAGVDLGTVSRFLRHRDPSVVSRYIHAGTARVRQEIEDCLGLHDGGALAALNAAQMDALVERISERVAQKLLQHRGLQSKKQEEPLK